MLKTASLPPARSLLVKQADLISGKNLLGGKEAAGAASEGHGSYQKENNPACACQSSKGQHGERRQRRRIAAVSVRFAEERYLLTFARSACYCRLNVLLINPRLTAVVEKRRDINKMCRSLIRHVF